MKREIEEKQATPVLGLGPEHPFQAQSPHIPLAVRAQWETVEMKSVLESSVYHCLCCAL